MCRTRQTRKCSSQEHASVKSSWLLLRWRCILALGKLREAIGKAACDRCNLAIWLRDKVEAKEQLPLALVPAPHSTRRVERCVPAGARGVGQGPGKRGRGSR